MSIEAITSRVAELRARIDALTSEPAAAPPSSQVQQSASIDGQPSIASVQPFNIALAQAQGLAELRPSESPGNLPASIDGIVQKYADRYGVNPSVVKAVIHAESDGNPASVSSKGAMGLMQLMPDEVKAYGITNPFDPEQSIAGGTRQLAKKLKVFNGDLPLALAAYNAGTGAVRKYGGIPPYKETQDYVKKVLSLTGK